MADRDRQSSDLVSGCLGNFQFKAGYAGDISRADPPSVFELCELNDAAARHLDFAEGLAQLSLASDKCQNPALGALAPSTD